MSLTGSPDRPVMAARSLTVISPRRSLTKASSRRVSGTYSGAKGGDLEAFAAGRALALGHLGHPKDRFQTNGHALQFPNTPALAVDFLAPARQTLDPVGPDGEHEPNAAILGQRFDLIVAFPDSKRMIQQTLTHASC